MTVWVNGGSSCLIGAEGGALLLVAAIHPRPARVARIEAIASIQTIKTGIIPPTINLEHPDPECDLDYVPNEARQAEVGTAMSNSFGFGGHNATLVIRRYDGG